MMHHAISRAAILLVGTALAAAPLAAAPALAQTTPNATPNAATPSPAMTAPATPSPMGSTGMNKVAPSPATRAAGVAPAQTSAGQKVENRAEAQINRLHRALKITSAEQPQWDAFAAVMRENAQHMDQVFADHGNPMNGTALDDMKAYEMITQAHADDVAKLEPAFETLYNAMSADQKQTADNVFHQYARQQAQRGAKG